MAALPAHALLGLGLFLGIGFFSPAAAGEVLTLSLVDVVARARAGAPAVQVGASDVAEARARRQGAAVFTSDHPSLSAIAGPRLPASLQPPSALDAQATLSVPLALGFRRARALDVSDAEIQGVQLAVDGHARAAIVDAVAAYLHAVHARARLEVAEQRLAIADQLLATAVERERVGDAARLEVNLAGAERARGASAVADAARRLGNALAALGDALGLPVGKDLAVVGELSEVSVAGLVAVTAVGASVDVDAARAEVRTAAAATTLADTGWWPSLSAQGQYAYDEGTHITMAGVGVTLPLFDNGQQQRAEAAVRADRGQLLVRLAETRVQREQHRAAQAHRHASDALAVLETDGLPRAVDNEGLAALAWTAGKIDLPTLLLLRRDALSTREEHLERLLEKALAALDVVAAGTPDTHETPDTPDTPDIDTQATGVTP